MQKCTSPTACRPSATLWQKKRPTFSTNVILSRVWKSSLFKLVKTRQHILRQRGSPRCRHVHALTSNGWPHKHTSKHGQRIKLGGRGGADLQWTALTMWKTNMWRRAQRPGTKTETLVACRSGGAGVHHWHFTSTVNVLSCAISVLYACWAGGIGFCKIEGPKCWKVRFCDLSLDWNN